MSGTPPTIEWYLARDGAQHGPISDIEMRKFVELGHLRSTDLVWCPQFTAWKSGGEVFPQTLQPRPAPMPAMGQPALQAQSASAMTTGAGETTQPANRTQPQTQPQAAQLRDPQATATPSAAPGDRRTASEDAAWAQAMRGMGEAPLAQASAASQPGGHSMRMEPALGSAPAGPAPFAIAPAATMAPQPSLDVSAADARLDAEDRTEEPKPRRRSWIGMATAAVAVVLIAGGVGWFSWQNRALVTGAGASAIGTVLATARPSMSSAEHFRTAPYQAAGETREQIDASLQRIAVWRFLKREFADWYGEIVGEVEKRRAQKQDERMITQFLVDVIVTLRRRNAQAALQASPDHLRAMAGAFVTNLKQLGSRDGATCFAFVSHGETSPFMIELSRTPAFAETLQKQLLAVFEAVVDARAGRKIHPNTRRSDYERLTADLTARGWTQNDLGTFSDPQKLSQTLPDKVCTLVQDWFATQLALKEPDLQVRLLAESLKPLVGG